MKFLMDERIRFIPLFDEDVAIPVYPVANVSFHVDPENLKMGGGKLHPPPLTTVRA
jgi:hypothetical protein